jgi:hypothetical protein
VTVYAAKFLSSDCRACPEQGEGERSNLTVAP